MRKTARIYKIDVGMRIPVHRQKINASRSLSSTWHPLRVLPEPCVMLVSQIDIQDLDMDVKTISSLRWAHHGTTQDNVNQWIDGGGASGAETGASCSSVSSEFLHPAPGISCSAGQASHGFTFGARSTGGPAAATGTFDAHLSLRDLLLEKWPPVPINEVSLGEATW